MCKFKITGRIFLFTIISIFLSGVLFFQEARAVRIGSDGVGIQIGSVGSPVRVRNAVENLFYGVVDGSSVQGSLLLLEKGALSDKRVFRVSLTGNITDVGSITTRGNIDTQASICFQGDCKSSWSDVLGGELQAIIAQSNNAQSANFWISGVGKATAFITDYFNAGQGSSIVNVTPPAGKEGVRIVSSDFSSLVVRNTADTSDLLRLDQAGNLAIAGTINSRSIGTALTDISVNAGQTITNVGLSANYIEGHDWAEISNLLSTIPPTSPEKHYFISSGSTNGNAGGFSGFDGLCNNDTNAIAGRSYHVYAGAGTNRDFRSGVLYSNKTYGTFAVNSAQSPDLCRVLGITCDTNWAATGGGNVWNTSANSCNGWTESSWTWSNGLYMGNPFNTGISAGTVQNSSANYCAGSFTYLCIEDSGGSITNPGSVCGNGATEFGEFCDDGNTSDDSTCPANCQADGGFCGDGFDATDEACEYTKQKWSGSSWVTYQDTAQCSTSCTWEGDLDGDSHAGQVDCWNNDANAYPGSPIESGSAKDMNCDGYVSSRSVTSCTNTDWQEIHTNWGFRWNPEYGHCVHPCPSSTDYCINDTTSYADACSKITANGGGYESVGGSGCVGSSGWGLGPRGLTWQYGYSCRKCLSESTTWYHW